MYRMPRSGRRGALGLPLAAVVAAGILVAPEVAAAAATFRPPAPQAQKSVPGTRVPVRDRAPDPAERAALRAAPAVAWPKAATVEVDVPVADALQRRLSAAVAPAAVPGTPLSIAPPEGGGRAPDRVRVAVADRSAALAARVDGLLLRVAATDTGGGDVALDVDYSGFRYAYGGDWGARLRLVRMPACALTTPAVEACREQQPLASRNDPVAGHVRAQVPVGTPESGASAGREGGVYAVTAAASGGTGDYKATSLSPAASWQVSPQTGDFSWSYPLENPPGVEGPEPDLELAYSSGGVDGRTASTNNQPSLVGEGFDLPVGYLERQYRSCADDGVGTKPGDLCWAGDEMVLVLEGHSGQLVRDDATGVWKPRSDDGTRVERLTGAVNGDNDGEYWKLTTTDGTQYFFGRNRLPGWVAGKPETKSAWTVPVFGDDAGEPCHGSTFDTSWCQQAWRWNLDHVVDADGNSMAFYYETETNYYGRNLTAGAATSYVRAGYPLRAEYGLRNGAEYTTTAPARLLFDVAERCIPTPSFDCAASKLSSATASSWPDVPYDRICAASPCTNQYSPSFFSRKRLTSVSTQVWGGSAYRDVDQWTFTHTFPAPGDGTSASLWLERISHTGKVGGSASTPDVKFDGQQRVNRVDALEGIAPMVKWRVSAIQTETGGTLNITYSEPDCTRAALPAPESNTRRCFPMYWVPEGAINPLLDWFHRYVVTQVVAVDNTGGGPFDVTSYEYLDGGAWHYDENQLAPATRRTWSQWRGYGRVRVYEGQSNEQRSMTEYRYFRGMDGDTLPGGASRSVSVTDSEGASVRDNWRLQDFEREEIEYDGPGGAIVSAEVSDPWLYGPTATQGSRQAYKLETSATRTRVAVGAGWLRTEVRTTFDSYGEATQVDDLGDTSTSADDQCTRYEYARNTAAWLIDPVAREETVGVACSVTPNRPADVISDERHYYDGAATYTTAATRGNETRVEELSGWSGGPVYVTTSRANHDVHGRVVESWDAAGGRSVASYTPATGGPVTGTAITNELGHTTSTMLEPAWGLAVSEVDANGRRTDVSYDPLGRLSKVWYPDRSKSGGQSPNVEYTYLLRTNGPIAVTTKTLRNDGSYQVGYDLFDSLLRPRQTQVPAPGGGRIVTDTFYNTSGLVTKTNDDYYNSSPPGTDLLLVADNVVPGQTKTVYDGAGRETAEIFLVYGQEKWRNTTTYGGNWVSMDPPDGATPTTTYLDARGRKTELRQYKGSSPTGAYDATKYTYTRDGLLGTVTDAAGNQWRNTYDLRGRLVKVEDPDRGTSTMVYDDSDRLASVTDARNRTVAYTYDALDRRTGMYDGSTAGPKLAEWTYDTLVKGLPTASTRYVGTDAYTSTVTGYDTMDRPTGTQVTVPASEGLLAGTYSFGGTYNVDGTVATVSVPGGGGLAAETLSYTYNELGMPTSLTGLSTYVGATTYAKLGMLQQVSYGVTGKRVVRDNTWQDGTNWLGRTTVDVEGQATARQADVTYDYDQAGNLLKMADAPSAGAAPADTQCFRYDYLRRLSEAWTPNGDCASAPAVGALGGPAPYWHSYTYDVTGNRLSEVRHAAGGDTTRTYGHPAAGQAQPHTVRTVATQGPAGSSTDQFGYDAAGNTTSRVVAGRNQTMEWDTEGHVSKITEGANATSFVYDADGDRLIRRDNTTVTLYLGGMELQLQKLVGVVKATRYYEFGGSTIAVRTYDNKLTWLVADHHNTAVLQVDSGTMAVSRRRQTPFGEERGPKPVAWKGDRGFVDGTMDATGLTHLGAREYDPALGRFLSVDPVIDPEDPQQLHGYAYGNNAPPTFSDPDGLWFSCGWCKKAFNAAKRVVRRVTHVARTVVHHARRIVHHVVHTVRRVFHVVRRAVHRAVQRVVYHAKRYVRAAYHAVRKAYHHVARKVRAHAARAYHAVRRVVHRAAHVVRQGARRTAHAASRAWHATASGAAKAAQWAGQHRSLLASVAATAGCALTGALGCLALGAFALAVRMEQRAREGGGWRKTAQANLADAVISLGTLGLVKTPLAAAQYGKLSWLRPAKNANGVRVTENWAAAFGPKFLKKDTGQWVRFALMKAGTGVPSYGAAVTAGHLAER
ncbi:RHS repeat-associated core domain-containing protein [Micromonospora sp. SL1-18]|uniref:RHS repeat-associated core domain-containing protein n=1 Tax=Micromonospora sp. SL1-18 TaxID=3399128 RepID=UPI003A4DD366